ncbi:MAG: hypothetical protein H6959_00685 [Chromatiaceae bacterium]|nr:hypothetical protein [Gammaproteobacteria bacterium]MCP5301120.1 hypothetical protein [Chromatiaceae bacterium]MCP5421408.1 hypothetical protein [Chromatiaceae bacterium]
MASDKAFERVHAWFVEAIDDAFAGVADAAQRAALAKVLWSLTDPKNPNVAPPPNASTAFNKPTTSGKSLSVAALVVGEVIVGIDPLKKAIDAIGGGNIAAARDAIKTVVDQVKSAIDNAGLHSSAFGLGKLLLTLSDDIGGNAPSTPVADKLAAAITSNGNANQRKTSSAALGVQTVVLGGILDKAFGGEQAIANWAKFSASTLAAPLVPPPLSLSQNAGDGKIEIKKFDPARGVLLGLSGNVTKEKVDGDHKLAFRLGAGGDVQVLWDGSGPAVAESNTKPLGLELDVALKKVSGNNGAISIPDPAGDPLVRLQVDELGGGLSLKKPAGGNQLAPSVNLRAKGGRIVIKVGDSLLSQVMGDDITVDFDIEVLADAAGGIRLKNGTGLRVNLPVTALPTGPFTLQLITFAIEPKDNFARIETELSISAGVTIGPFQASVERIGALLEITVSDGTPVLKFKPPTGLGMSLDAGVVKGGGFLSLDPDLGEYSGALELKLASISVKALGLLNTRRPPNNDWSLLLLIFANFPSIQLSWGFTLNGVGGLIGVQHTADTGEMSKALGNGALDAVLFPQDVVANAPQIFETLKTLFPYKAGGFIIGPMVEIGWGTPSLVIIRAGILIEASQLALLGQLIIQVPPLVDKQLAILRLQLDFVGVIVFDPFKIGFDGKLRDSHVAKITLTGQFAFRAAFGDQSTFLLSAGGFHPRFADIPPDIPAPFARIGAGFDIGIIGVSIKVYFAVTAATVQGGAEIKAWGDVGVASFDAGLGFDAIFYLKPKFYFEVDFRAWANAQAFGIEFGVRLEGLLKGPGRWRIRGVGTVDLGLLGSVSVDFDESWGSDTDTPLVTENAFLLLEAEAAKRENWSVQLPSADESYCTFVKREGEKEIVAHPLAALAFTQTRVPLAVRLDKVGDAAIEGPNTLDIEDISFPAGAAHAAPSVKKEQFAASQFFNMSDDDRLGKPSFEAMAAGRDFNLDDFVAGPSIECPVDWETRDLSPPPGFLGGLSSQLLGAHLFGKANAKAQWMVATGAVARSGLRELDAMLPADAAPLTFRDAAPTAVTGIVDQQPVVQQAFSGVFAAEQGLRSNAGSQRAAEQTQVAELFELV